MVSPLSSTCLNNNPRFIFRCLNCFLIARSFLVMKPFGNFWSMVALLHFSISSPCLCSVQISLNSFCASICPDSSVISIISILYIGNVSTYGITIQPHMALTELSYILTFSVSSCITLS